MYTAQTKTATITGLTANGTSIVYTATNTFAVGEIVHISGIVPVNLNIPDAVITARTSSTFTVASTETGTWVSGGTAVYDELKNHLISSSAVRVNTLVSAEWNLNSSDNIKKVGNYRYRPDISSGEKFKTIASSYVEADTNYDYTNATYADVAVDTGLDDDNVPDVVVSQNEKTKMLFSLQDCFGKNRPRSGINKLMALPGRFINITNEDMAERPRYYAADKDDNFKYWCSFRTEAIQATITAVAPATPSAGSVRYTANNSFSVGDSIYINNLSPSEYNGEFLITARTATNFTVANTSTSTLINANGTATAKTAQRGIAKPDGGDFYIHDAAPFVVYRTAVPANRVVVKMQTHVGSAEFSYGDAGATDPFYGDANKMVPKDWKIQKLTAGNAWETIIDNLDQDDVPTNGYVEICYGLSVPISITSAWTEDTFYYIGDYATESDLPANSITGYGYIVGSSSTDPGTWYVWDGDSYEQNSVVYEWKMSDQSVSRHTPFAKDLTSPTSFTFDGDTVYKEVDYVNGLRIVVTKMNKANATFDLIELSPRLAVDLSDKTTAFSVTKHASDLGNSGMPVGQLLAGSGSLTLFDYDQAFNPSNTNSIINNFIAKNLQVKMHEITRYVNGKDYYVPIKTMFCFGFPNYSSEDRTVSLELRDQFLMFESMVAPELFIRDVSLSYAVSVLLDSCGFANYIFKRIPGNSEPIIPFFYIPPQTSVAQVLQNLAVSTQHMMFFDEYNNFIVMSKEYSMPKEEDRSTDFVLYGSQDYSESTTPGELKVKTNSKKLANIVSVASKISDIYNDGKISYSVKSIQRENTMMQKKEIDRGRSWIYKAALLWEAPPPPATKSINYVNEQQAGYALTAIPLKSTLSELVPEYANKTTGISTTTNIVSGNKEVIVASTAGLVVNQTITKTGGSGIFARQTVQIVSIDSATQITVNLPHSFSGPITFTANEGMLNNIIDFGDTVYWLPRYNGYFYANGEIIKYDAVEYTVQGIGNVWLTDVKDYESYFSKLSFGKKIYPTGRVRIYSKIDADKNVIRHGRGQFGTSTTSHPAGLASNWTDPTYLKGFTMKAEHVLDEKAFAGTTELGDAGTGGGTTNVEIARKNSKVTGLIKNVLVTEKTVEVPSEIIGLQKNVYSDSAINPSVQASALVMSGPSPKVFANKKIKGKNFITYVQKQLDNKFVHFGTRLRIVGKPADSETYPSAGELENPEVYFEKNKIAGGGAGLAIMLDTTNNINTGYYFEIVALGYSNIEDIKSVNNMFFYKIKKNAANNDAIPELLWKGNSQIIVDRGDFTGQNRIYGEQLATVHELAVEYEDIGSTRKFYLYLNNNIVGVYEDKKPLPVKKNMALFVRGSTKAMFENVYALRKNYAYGENNVLTRPPAQSASVFDDTSITIDESLSKYSMSGLIKSTMLTNIGTSGSKYNIYYDEFGTIMRECDYFDIKYDKAYPALFSKISPTFTDTKGYFVSGFRPTAYGAEFLVFNCTDSVLTVGENGEYLRIQGVALTDDVSSSMTVDNYYNKKADFSNPEFAESSLVTAKLYEDYVDIVNSRNTYGTKYFDITAPYIQSHDEASHILGWIISKISKPRKAVGLKTFGTSYAQLGDIVEVNYSDSDNVSQVSLGDSRYVVYSMEYSYSENGPEHTLYLSEVQ
jgi:hypothetical protein